MSEARVRDALAAIAGEVEADRASELWGRTQRRITSRRRQLVGRALVAGAATIALIVAGVAVLAGDGEDDEQPITAGPEAVAVPGEILAVVDGDVVVLSMERGAPSRVVVDGPSGFETEVGATADGGALVYTRVADSELNCSDDLRDLVLRGASDDRIVTAGGPFLPIVSPDGRYVAYRMSECEFPSAVGLTALDTRANFQINADEDSELDDIPLAWTPDSQSLLVSLAGSYEIVSAPVGEDRRPVELPDGTHRAVFTSADEVVVAYPAGDSDIVAAVDLVSGERRDLFDAPLGRVMSLSYDDASKAVLVASQSERDTLLQWVRADASERAVVAEVDGLHAALWSHAEGRGSDAEQGDQIAVPDVRGLSEADAVAALSELGFEVTLLDAGPRVVDQRPAAGESVDEGAVVSVTLGGVVQPTSAMPDVEGLGLSSALAELEEVGFTVVVEGFGSSVPESGLVVWQEPPAGSAPLRDRAVRLWSCRPNERCITPPPGYVEAFEPASDWRPIDRSDARWAETVDTTWNTPAELGLAVADQIRTGFEQDETVSSAVVAETPAMAELWVRFRNAPDDSVFGQDLRLTAELRDGRWVWIFGELREICARGSDVGASCP